MTDAFSACILYVCCKLIWGSFGSMAVLAAPNLWQIGRLFKCMFCAAIFSEPKQLIHLTGLMLDELK